MNEENYNYRGKRYIALARASDASEGTTSTEAQLAMLHEKAKALGMTLADQIVLDGVSGSMPGKRQDMADILRRKMERDDFDVLVIQRLDRLTRSGSDHGFWFEHECKRAGIELLVVGDDIPQGRYAALIKVAKYEAAQEQAFSISQRSTQGYQLALEQGRVTTSSHTPYACWRLYLGADDKPLHVIRDLRDGRQQKLDAQTHAVIDTYGCVGCGAKGHYRKQKHEKVLLVPGDSDEFQVVRRIFDLHFRQGWGGKRIADTLNRQAIASPYGRKWSQHQVEVIYNQEVYTGRSVANRTSSAIYHQRSATAPKPVHLDGSVRATARTIPPRLRPADEWFIAEQPLMRDFLGDEQLREMAIAAQDAYWHHLADPNRAKLSKSKHRTSDYLLSGILHAKQDDQPLIGVLCGRVGKKVRYYRHRRGRTGYLTGSIFNRMIHAETVERAVIDAAKQMLSDGEALRDRIIAMVQRAQSNPTVSVDIDTLRKQRDRLRRRTELIVSTLDDETLNDARSELDKIKDQRRQLEEQIKQAENKAAAEQVAPETIADRVIAQLSQLADLAMAETKPCHALRQWLGAIVSKVVVDMETKNIEIHLAPSPEMLQTAFSGEKPMRLVTTSELPTGYETHRDVAPALGFVDCQYNGAANHICYRCHRRKAA